MLARSDDAVPIACSYVPCILINRAGGAAMSGEIILEADQVFRWEGPKRKSTLARAKLGRLVLTDRHLLFLSTGSNDISAMRLVGAAVSPLAALRTGRTSQLDLAAARAPGGLEIPLEQLVSAELTSMFKVLTIRWRSSADELVSSTFAPKNGGMPSGPSWVAALTEMSKRAETSDLGDRSDPDVSDGPVDVVDRPRPPATGFRDPERLAASVEEITGRFGPGVLDEPERMRNLLRDAYGSSSIRDRSDVDVFVSVLEQHPLADLARGVSCEDVTAQVMAVTALPDEVASWSVAILRTASSASPALTLMPSDESDRSNGSTAGHVRSDRSANHSRGTEAPSLRTGSHHATVVTTGSVGAPAPRRRSRAIGALAAVGLVVAGASGWAIGRSGDDAVTTVAVAAGAGDIGDGAETAGEALTVQVDELREANLATEAELAEVTSQLDASAQQLGTVTADLEAARALHSPFEAGHSQPPLAFSGSGTLTACEGFGSPCVDPFFIDARTFDENGTRYFEVASVATVPIATMDSFTWGGQAEVTGEFGFHSCDGVRSPTTMSVTLIPSEFRVSPTDRTVSVSAYRVTYTFSNDPSGGCTAASRTYAGDFHG
jgi:hypothetical protein